MDAGPRSVHFEERCNCSRKIFFVLDYTFARRRGGPAIEERERYRRTARGYRRCGNRECRERGKVNICGSRPQD